MSTITKEILKQFCGEDETRVALMEPWTHGVFSYATDGRVIVRVPALESPTQNPLPPQHASVLHLLELELCDGNFRLIPTPEGGWGALCDFCRGTGRTNKLRCDECYNTVSIETEIDCQRCEKGRVTWSNKVMLGKTSLNQYYVEIICRLLPGAEFSENKGGNQFPVSFRFNGGIGLLMPLRQY